MTTLDAALLILAAAAIGLCLFILTRPRGPVAVPSEALLRAAGDVGSLKSQMDGLSAQTVGLGQTLGTLHAAVREVESRLVERSAGMQEAIGRQLQEARVAMERLQADTAERRRLEDEIQASARRVEAVLLGTRTRGLAGENILEEAFRQLPPGMVEANFRVNGKVVEYALVLANAKRLAVDSKWPSPDLLDRLGEEPTNGAAGLQVTADVERVLKGKVREVRQYIDPAVTLSFAIAAVPDAVFNTCRRAHLEAFSESVIAALRVEPLQAAPPVRPLRGPGEPGRLRAADRRLRECPGSVAGEQRVARERHDPERLHRL